jgi:hypothetical protein
MEMSTDIIDPSLHTTTIPTTYTGPGTLIGNPRQSGGLDCNVYGYFTSDGNAVQINVGFRPLEVHLDNMTDGIEWDWFYGYAATDTIKTVLGGSLSRAIDTTSAIVPSEPAPSGGGNWIVTLSAAAVGTSKLICFQIDG